MLPLVGLMDILKMELEENHGRILLKIQLINSGIQKPNGKILGMAMM